MKGKLSSLIYLILAGVISILLFNLGPTYILKPNHAEAQIEFEFSDFGEITLPVQQRTYYGMIGDMNGDGRPDIVLGGTGRIIIIKNNIGRQLP